MNPKGTLEFRPMSESARLDQIIDPAPRHKGTTAPKRGQGHRLFKRKWMSRMRRRSLASACPDTARLLSAGEERSLAERVQAGDIDAEQTLVTANLALVLKAVNDYTRCGVPEDDLIQEGNLGLIRAARHFDPSTHTTRFATYATYWIRCFMVRALASNSSFCQSLGDLTLADGAAPDQELVRDEDQALVCAALRRLSPFEAWVICERFGLSEPAGRTIGLATRRSDPTHESDGRAKPPGRAGVAPDDEDRAGDAYFQRSYLDMGRECGLSVFRLRQVEKTALDKLRRALAACARERT